MFITRILEEAKQQLTKASGSWAVSRVQTRPPSQSLRRRKRTGRRASCRHAGREGRVRRLRGWQGCAGPRLGMENEGDGDDDEDGMAHQQWRTTGPPLSPQETSEKDIEKNSHKGTETLKDGVLSTGPWWPYGIYFMSKARTLSAESSCVEESMRDMRDKDSDDVTSRQERRGKHSEKMTMGGKVSWERQPIVSSTNRSQRHVWTRSDCWWTCRLTASRRRSVRPSLLWVFINLSGFLFPSGGSETNSVMHLQGQSVHVCHSQRVNIGNIGSRKRFDHLSRMLKWKTTNKPSKAFRD